MTEAAGSTGTGFGLTVTAASASSMTVLWKATDGSAVGGSDYVAVSSDQVTVPANLVGLATDETDALESPTTSVIDDSLYEGGTGTHEHYYVDLVFANGGTVGTPSRGTVSVEDNEAEPVITFLGDVTVLEPADGFSVNVELTAVTDTASSLDTELTLSLIHI